MEYYEFHWYAVQHLKSNFYQKLRHLKAIKVKRKADQNQPEDEVLMVNPVQNFISAVQNLTGEQTSRNLSAFCQKWVAEFFERASPSDGDKIIKELAPVKFSIGNVCGQILKLSKLKTDAEIAEFINVLSVTLVQYDQRQLLWSPDLYYKLFEDIADQLLKRNLPLWGIKLVRDALLHFTNGNPLSILTDLHYILFCLCLKARHFEYALPFFNLDIVEMFNYLTRNSVAKLTFSNDDQRNTQVSSSGENASGGPSSLLSTVQHFARNLMAVSSSQQTQQQQQQENAPKDDIIGSSQEGLIKRRSVLLYFYYGALILAATEQWERAELFLEHAICLPAPKASAIVVEAFKKYILIGLILGRTLPEKNLPAYRSPSIQRSIIKMVTAYTNISRIMQRCAKSKSDASRVVTLYLSEKSALFKRDNNFGLVKVLINATKENALKRLANVFVSLQLKDVTRLAFVSDQAEAERSIYSLVRDDKLFVRIDDFRQTFRFEEEIGDNASEDGQMVQVEKALSEVIKLSEMVRSVDNAVRQNPAYISKKIDKLESSGGHAGGRPLTSIYDEDLFCEGMIE